MLYVVEFVRSEADMCVGRAGLPMCLVACLYLAERSRPLVLQFRVEHIAAAGVREVEA